MALNYIIEYSVGVAKEDQLSANLDFAKKMKKKLRYSPIIQYWDGYEMDSCVNEDDTTTCMPFIRIYYYDVPLDKLRDGVRYMHEMAQRNQLEQGKIYLGKEYNWDFKEEKNTASEKHMLCVRSEATGCLREMMDNEMPRMMRDGIEIEEE